MSVLNQNYTVECYNGSVEEYRGNIYKLVQKHSENFRKLFGTAFNLRKIPEGVRRYDNRESAYYVSVGRNHQRPTYDRAGWRKYWMRETVHYWRLADCKYIIRDGFGRAVHPDVIYRAVINEFGAIKTKFNHGTWMGHRNGVKRGCYGSMRNLKVKQQITQQCESDQCIDDAPKIRMGKSAKFIRLEAMCWWDDARYTHPQKNWKTQSKARKQWAKNLK